MPRTARRVLRTMVWGMRLLPLIVLVACSGAAPPQAAAPPTPTLIPSGDIVDFPIAVRPGFRISLYARDLGEARMVAFDAQGVPYVTLMNRSKPGTGRVVALPDRNGDGKADEEITVLDNVDRPHGLVFHDGHMYVSDPQRIFRIIDDDHDLHADRTEIVVDGMPESGDHWSRPFAFDKEGGILAAIGSTCDACHEGNKRRATIQRYTPETPKGVTIARGLRSVVGFEFRPGTDELWVAGHGRDNLGPALPPDILIKVQEGKHYGWPYCYGNNEVDPGVLNDPGIFAPDDMPKDEFCRTQVTAPDMLLPPHVAPLVLTFYEADQFPTDMRGGMFMAWHGAWDFSNKNGYKVVFIPFKDGKPQEPEDFVTGWLKEDGSTWYARPTGVAVGPNGSLYITDDVLGNVYRVDYIGAP